ncbi:MAG: right-handed parallel beta-helix repeat-containing protein, partial [Lentisphaerae bacterium]|nr:right-handed parallel beta-helix repeat-containing protein [Lentisphaerota bacterium]
IPTGEAFGDHPSTELEFYPGEGGFNPSAEWKHPEEAILHVRWFMGTQIFQLRGIDHERNRFLLGRGGWHWNSRIFPMEDHIKFSRAHIENVFEELTDPGEWYHDKRKHVLYYMPETGETSRNPSQARGSRLATVSPSNCPADCAPSPLEGETVASRSPMEGEDMASAVVEVPRLRQLIELRGDQDNPVRHVTFSGFRFTHTTTVFMEPWEAPSMGDWTIHRSGAVHMKGAEDCAIENSVFHATGGNAVMMDGYNLRNRVSGCTFTETGESAVCLVGYNMRRLGTARPFPDECVVHNNHMHHLGEYQIQVAGVFLSCCQKTTVSHNDIHDIPRAAILVNDPTWGGHIIEYNRLYRTCLDSADHGPFNSWGRTRHWCFNRLHGPDWPSHPAGNVEDDALFLTELRYNYIEEHGNFGVDQDDGTCRMRIHHNVLVGCPVKFQCGTDSVAENNIFVDFTLATRMAMVNEYNTDRFVRNIVVARKDMPLGAGYGVPLESCPRHFYHAVQCPVEGPLLEEIDHNLFWSDVGEFRACVTPGDHGKRTGNGTETDVLSLPEWQALGYDRHSVFADPLFVDEANGDYRLQPDSPALKLGIEGISTEGWGLLPEFLGERP